MSNDHERGHDDLEKIVKLTETFQSIPQSKPMKDFSDESYLTGADIFRENRRTKLSGRALDEAADKMFSSLAKMVFANELKDGAAKYEQMKAFGDIVETRTGESYNQLDRVIGSLAGFNRESISRLLGSNELSPELMGVVQNQLTGAYTSVSQNRTVDSSLKNIEDVALAIKYLNKVKKDANVPDKFKQLNVPEDFLKTGRSYQEGRELYKEALQALCNYKPQMSAHGNHGRASH